MKKVITAFDSGYQTGGRDDRLRGIGIQSQIAENGRRHLLRGHWRSDCPSVNSRLETAWRRKISRADCNTWIGTLGFVPGRYCTTCSPSVDLANSRSTYCLRRFEIFFHLACRTEARTAAIAFPCAVWRTLRRSLSAASVRGEEARGTGVRG